MAESVKYPTAAGKIVTSRPPLSRQQTRPDGPGQAWGRPPWLQSSAIAAQRAPNGRKIDRRSGAAPRKRSATAPLLSGGMGEVGGRGAAGRPSEFLSAAPSMALGNCGSVLHGLGLPGTRGGGGFSSPPPFLSEIVRSPRPCPGSLKIGQTEHTPSCAHHKPAEFCAESWGLCGCIDTHGERRRGWARLDHS